MDEAVAEFQKARKVEENQPWALGKLGHVYAARGKRMEAKKLVAELGERARHEFVEPHFVAEVYAGLGEKDEAFSRPQKAYEDRSFLMAHDLEDPGLDSLRSDAHFKKLLGRLGLPP